MTLVYSVAAGIGHRDPVLVLVLTGVVIGALLGSGVALLKYLADPLNQLPAITFWLLGSLAAFNRADLWVLVPTVILALVPLALLRWRLDVMCLGEEEATALGVNVRSVRGAVIIGATLMTAASVSVSGIVGWVGLLVPHLARLIVGPAFARLLPIDAGDRRRLPAAGRYGRAHGRRRRDAARRADGGARHAGFHLALGARAARRMVSAVIAVDGAVLWLSRPHGRRRGRFALEPGEVMCLLGPNGGGKSTLLKTVLGLLPLQGGTVRVDGEDTADWTAQRRALSLGYVPQSGAGQFAYTLPRWC